MTQSREEALEAALWTLLKALREHDDNLNTVSLGDRIDTAREQACSALALPASPPEAKTVPLAEQQHVHCDQCPITAGCFGYCAKGRPTQQPRDALLALIAECEAMNEQAVLRLGVHVIKYQALDAARAATGNPTATFCGGYPHFTADMRYTQPTLVWGDAAQPPQAAPQEPQR